ncbi:hypothetical protein D8802_08805 [Streptococcus oralis]|uniref:Uncharacterized protein n=1 Tax=Streptococcus oralis TaxID=1303 RepID=A0A428FTD3_STROR|nr:hypothetical protein D8802_08805 [Streptococcus oralis]
MELIIYTIWRKAPRACDGLHFRTCNSFSVFIRIKTMEGPSTCRNSYCGGVKFACIFVIISSCNEISASWKHIANLIWKRISRSRVSKFILYPIDRIRLIGRNQNPFPSKDNVSCLDCFHTWRNSRIIIFIVVIKDPSPSAIRIFKSCFRWHFNASFFTLDKFSCVRD